jgi:hypothetical protein
MRVHSTGGGKMTVLNTEGVDPKYIRPRGRSDETVRGLLLSLMTRQLVGPMEFRGPSAIRRVPCMLSHKLLVLFVQSVERAMSVTALVGWGKGCDPYIKPETMMYYRAIIDGMPALYPDGKEACPESYFGTATYKYLKSLHTKSMSSTRGEFSGTKGIRVSSAKRNCTAPRMLRHRRMSRLARRRQRNC